MTQAGPMTASLIASCLRRARAAARAVLRRPAWYEEVAERTVHRLVLRHLAQRAPEHPRAWAARVSRNLAIRISRMGGVTRVLSLDTDGREGGRMEVADMRAADIGERELTPREHFEAHLARLKRVLTQHQVRLLGAVLQGVSIRALARHLGTYPRNIRATLFKTIVPRIRRLVPEFRTPVPPLVGALASHARRHAC